MTELKLSELKGFLPDKKDTSNHKEYPTRREMTLQGIDHGHNDVIDELSTKNLLDYVEAVVCPDCYGTRVETDRSDKYVGVCKSCKTGAVIRVKEGK